ncbi:MAG TPA: hypothetical protein VFY93_07695 [Planctomycetota bacterium]|nr:hypothetical protein [Planctomycetota bacterium]
MRRLLLFPALLAAACGSAPKPVPQDRVILEPSRKPTGTPKQPPDWFDREIEAAAEDLRAGRLEEGLARVRGAKAEGPSGDDALDLDDLMRRLNQAVLELPTLDATVVPERDPIAFGDPVRITVRLHNPGRRTVRVPVRDKPAPASARGISPHPPTPPSTALFVLDVVRTEYDVNARVVTLRRQVHHPLGRDLELPPGATTEIVFTVDDAGNERPLDGFRTYVVSGQMRAAVIELGGLRRYEALRIRAGTLRAFRPNFEHLADDPTRRVRQAIEARAPTHLLTAAALVPVGERREAVEALVASLRGGGPMDFAAFSALAYLTNADLGTDANAWRSWWSRVREHYFDAPIGEGPGEGPRFAGAR